MREKKIVSITVSISADCPLHASTTRTVYAPISTEFNDVVKAIEEAIQPFNEFVEPFRQRQ